MAQKIEENRHFRQLILPEIGAEGQKKLADASVLVVGVGGLGCPAATYLASAGIGRIGLCDADVVSLTNLNRQVLYTDADLGKKKAECAAARLKDLAPETSFDVRAHMLDAGNADNIIAEYDLVLDCSDNFRTRFLIDDACARVGKPWIYGAVGGGYTGQLALMNGHSGRRYTDLYPATLEELEATVKKPIPVIGFVPGVIGTMQAAEAVKFIVGFGDVLDGRLFFIDLKSMLTGNYSF